jgi:hypothetical protein
MTDHENIQEMVENEGVSFKRIAIHDVVAYELLRMQHSFHVYMGLEKIYRFIDVVHSIGVFRNALCEILM